MSGESYANGTPRVHQISEKSLALVFTDPGRSFATTDRELKNIGRPA
jgi:hypothetical protein